MPKPHTGRRWCCVAICRRLVSVWRMRYGHRGDWRKRWPPFARCSRSMPTMSGAVYNLGSALQALGRADQAFTAFSRAVRLKPDFAQAHNNLGILHYDRMEWEQALACFTVALRLQAGFSKARNNQGMALHKLGRRTEAEAAFREAIRLKPDHIESFDNLSALLLETGRTEEAFGLFMRRAALVREALLPPESRKQHDMEQAAFRGRTAAAVEIEGGAHLPGIRHQFAQQY